jgi:hypothetical protein
MTLTHRIARSLALLVIFCSAPTLVACHHGSGQPGSTPTPEFALDSLFASLDDVRQISGLSDLKADPQGAQQQPYRPQTRGPGPCLAFSDQQVAFGDTWKSFREVSYEAFRKPFPGAASSLSSVNQVAGVYPDPDTARAVFNKLPPQFEACAALHAKYYNFTLDQPDPATITLTYTGDFQSTTVYKVQSKYILLVSANAMPHSGQTALDILQKITGHIH